MFKCPSHTAPSLPGIPVGSAGWPAGFSVPYCTFLPPSLGDACCIEGVRWGKASGLPVCYWEIPGGGVEVLGSSETLISMPVSLTPVWVMCMPSKFFLLLSYLNLFSLYLIFCFSLFLRPRAMVSDSISENTTMKILSSDQWPELTLPSIHPVFPYPAFCY